MEEYELKAKIVVDATKNDAVDDDDKKIVYHILTDLVHYAVLLSLF